MSHNNYLIVLKYSVIALLMLILIPNLSFSEEPELATPMGELQRLTHKLSLAAQHKNPDLARFYLEESLVLIAEIQEDIPEYQKIPVAVFIDRFALPAYREMQVLLRENNNEFSMDALAPSVERIISGCNTCHNASKFGFIKITNPTTNPFNQDFNP